jgi:hypothetical protein
MAMVKMTRDQHATIEAFLDRASERISAAPNKLPFEPVQGNLIIAWLRGRYHAPATNVVTGELSRPIAFLEERKFEFPNLDCMSVDELNKFSGVASTLCQYASLKATAMLWREQGRIEDAKRSEKHLETLYQMLPEEWRW